MNVGVKNGHVSSLASLARFRQAFRHAPRRAGNWRDLLEVLPTTLATTYPSPNQWQLEIGSNRVDDAMTTTA
jgi:hypothetical protein